MMPTSYIRLAAGRSNMNEQTQALCFMAGANSIFYGCKLLTAPNAEQDQDRLLFKKLGIKIEKNQVQRGNNEQEHHILNKVIHSNTELFYNAAP